MAKRELPIARIGLAALLAAMAIGQASNLGGFIDMIESYRLGGDGAAIVVALLLVAAEAFAAAGLLSRSMLARRRGATAGVVVAVAWSLLASQAFARGLAVPNCGCFGVYAGQELRWWVLVEDAEFVAWALWIHRHTRQPTTPRLRVRSEVPAVR